MDVLEALADRPMRAKELADLLDIKWTTAYRTLAYLVDNGYLKRDDASGNYYVGSRLYYIGSAYVAHLPILQLSRPYLKAASEETGATVQLVERDGYRSVVLSVSEPRSEYIPKTTIGYHFPLHCGSKGHVLLAYTDPRFVDEYLNHPLEVLTPYTITDPDVLREHLAEVRAQEYAVTVRDVQVSTASVAAPVRDAGGGVIASVCLIATFADFEETRARLVDVAVNTARSISQLMGWRPPLGVRGRVGAERHSRV
jgi:IclR family transcriptional regulator, KDG regulon repressor